MEYFTNCYNSKLYNNLYVKSNIRNMYEYAIFSIFNKDIYVLRYDDNHDYNRELITVGCKYIDDDKTAASCILNNNELVWWN